jgi:hypothetical protein
MTHMISDTTLTQFAKLADLLEQASRLARKLSRKASVRKLPAIPIPDLKRPKRIPKDQAWSWTEEWQAGEREANADLKAGRYKEFDSVEELIADLHAHV